MRLYFRDLPSYQNLTEAQKLHPLYSPNLSFNLDRLPAALSPAYKAHRASSGRSGTPSKALDPQNRQTALLHKNPR